MNALSMKGIVSIVDQIIINNIKMIPLNYNIWNTYG